MIVRYSRALISGLALAALVSVGAGLSARAGGGGVAAEDDAGRPFLVKIHADWCGTCVRLEPTWTELEAKLSDRARLVVLDVTDRATIEHAAAEADRLGLRAFFDAHKAKTGTVGVLHGSTREVVQVMKGELSVARYEAAVAEAAGSGPS